MKAIDLVNQYASKNAGMSNYVDAKLGEIRTALHDANWRKNEDETDWAKLNMRIAESIAVHILQVIPHETPVRASLADIYRAIVDEK